MLKKGTNIFISIILLLPLFTGVGGLPQMINNGPPSFQKTCDMDHCNPYIPKCPLCPSSTSVTRYLPNGVAIHPPFLSSLFNLLSIDTLSDQGVVMAIFHPPTTIS
jgi:hypothetical protein